MAREKDNLSAVIADAQAPIEAAAESSAPEREAPQKVRAMNVSATTLTIPSQDYKLFPPGRTEEITAEEAERFRCHISVQ